MDLFHAHIGGIDTLARSLLVAAAMIERGDLERLREERYQGWSGELGKSILAPEASLETISQRVMAGGIDPRPASGRQELLENLVNREIWSACPERRPRRLTSRTGESERNSGPWGDLRSVCIIANA